MVKFEVEIEEEVFDQLKKIGLELIKNDPEALVNYAAEKALEFYMKKLESEGK